MNATTLSSRITAWRGFLIVLMIAGALMTINGLANPALDRPNRIGFVVFGVWAALVAVILWFGKAKTKFEPLGKLGLRQELRGLPLWAWICTIVLTVAAIVTFVVARGR